MWMEMEADPLYGVPEKLVSVQLLKNKLVFVAAYGRAFDGKCSYTGDFTKVVRLRTVVEIVDDIIMQYFGDPDNEGVGWDSRFGDEETLGFHSEEGGYITPNNRSFYNDMHQLMFDTGFLVDDDELETDIAEALNYHPHLIEQAPYGANEAEVRWIDWRQISDRAMKMAAEGRGLDEMVRAEAARLDYLKSDIYTAQIQLQVEKDITLYRAVNYSTEKNPLLFGNLTSPPIGYTRDLRMSRVGDSVFYGSASKVTTTREALKDAGDAYTYVSKFKSKHRLRLLDLTGVPGQLTIFDHKQFHLLSFLRSFCAAVSEYVAEDDTIKYAPTQLMTYYFRHNLRHYNRDGSYNPIDGILYTSSKDGNMNAVLFYDNDNSSQHLELLECECMHDGVVKKVNVG